MFDRTHFKRLSKNNTTYLIRPLTFTDTEIHVADAEALTPPIPSKKIPGIVLIDGERIEFNKVDGNVLKQLRRSTLGTAPAFYSQDGTKVIDQGVNQTIPFKENTFKQTQFTSLNSNTYIITTATTTATGDGIVLSSESIIDPIDQIYVIYGGRQLRKFGSMYHDISVAFDSSEFTLKGSVASLAQLPTNPVKNDAYIVTATNQVWIYKDSSKFDSIYGYEYNGLNYIEPEFFVSVSTTTGQLLTLNLKDEVQNNVKLTIVKKDFARSTVWNNETSPTTTLSLIDSTTVPAKFLQAQPAELPDKYYYGGSVELEDNGSPLLDENDDPLTEL
jgi:hypothetical protein